MAGSRKDVRPRLQNAGLELYAERARLDPIVHDLIRTAFPAPTRAAQPP